MSRLAFFDRRDPSQYFFTDPYDFCVQRPENVIFTNTFSPFTNLSYYKGGGSRDGEERFKSYFAINANKRLGFGFYIDYLYGRGLYKDQSTAFLNGGLFSSYRGDKYDMHFIFNNDNLKMAENGGWLLLICDIVPVFPCHATGYGADRIPVLSAGCFRCFR